MDRILCINLLVYTDHRGAHCAPAIFITECTINHICRAGCPHPAAERHHKIVPPAHVTARPPGRCKHRPLQISFSVRGKILPFFPFNTFSSSSSYKKRAQCPIFIGAVRVLLTPNSSSPSSFPSYAGLPARGGRTACGGRSSA